jgi:hypothetical protein
MNAWVIDRMLDDLRALHHARNLDVFKVLAGLIMKKWREVYLQTDAAKWFESTYLKERWMCFYVSASGKPGIMPSTQHIEALHKHMKETDFLFLNGTHADLVGHSFEGMMSNHAVGYVGNSINLARSATPTEFAARATLIEKHNRGKLCINYKQVQDKMYFNVRAKLSKKKIDGHENVTEVRIRDYEEGLTGRGGELEDFDEFLKKYAGLCKVEMKEGVVVCECKEYWHSLVCPHVLVYERKCKNSPFLSVALSQVPSVGVHKGRKSSVLTIAVKKSRKITCSSHEGRRQTSKEHMRSKVIIHTYVYTYIHT